MLYAVLINDFVICFFFYRISLSLDLIKSLSHSLKCKLHLSNVYTVSYYNTIIKKKTKLFQYLHLLGEIFVRKITNIEGMIQIIVEGNILQENY